MYGEFYEENKTSCVHNSKSIKLFISIVKALCKFELEYKMVKSIRGMCCGTVATQRRPAPTAFMSFFFKKSANKILNIYCYTYSTCQIFVYIMQA